MFPGFETILEYVGKAALSRATNGLLDGLWEACKSEILPGGVAGAAGVGHLPDGLEAFENALLHRPSWWRAQFRGTNRRGILLIGPSGAGKSRVFSEMTGRKYSGGPTRRTTVGTSNLGSRVVVIRDTIGDPTQERYGIETREAITRGHDVIAIVVANGYLDTPGTAPRTRPERTSAARDGAAYLKSCLNEEIEWLDEIQRRMNALPERARARAVLVVANKVEHWGRDPVDLKHYNRAGRAFRSALDRFVEKTTPPGTIPLFVACTAEYNSFRHGDGSPAAIVQPRSGSTEGSKASMTMLRALLEVLQACG